jgi:hypothetical protein
LYVLWNNPFPSLLISFFLIIAYSPNFPSLTFITLQHSSSEVPRCLMWDVSYFSV